MSAIFLVKFHVKNIDYTKLNHLANDIVSDALSNNYAVFFNDNYAEVILKKNIENSFLISDSFLYKHGDEILDITEFVCDEEGLMKERFMHKYAFLNQLMNILFRHGILSLDIYITEDGDECVERYICLETKRADLLENLFQTFIRYSSQTGYTFPNVKIQVQED